MSDAHEAAHVPHQPNELLRVLLTEVQRTRAARASRQGRSGVTEHELDTVRMAALQALENYVSAIESLNWPVPRTILQDLRVSRALCGAFIEGGSLDWAEQRPM